MALYGDAHEPHLMFFSFATGSFICAFFDSKKKQRGGWTNALTRCLQRICDVIDGDKENPSLNERGCSNDGGRTDYHIASEKQQLEFVDIT